MQLRHETTRTFLQETDHIVAVCEWARRLLMRNGVPASKLTLSRHGILQTQKALGQNAACFGADPTVDSKPTCLRLAFLGRFDPAKGGEILIRAVRRLADAPLRLDIYGVSQGQGGQSHESQLRALAATDERIHFFPTLARGEVSLKLRRYDLLAVPSQWLETGPLVVLEAFSAGVPVIGSRLGGVAELVADGVDGLLVESGNSEAWANALRRLLDTPVLVRSLRDGVRPPRSMRTVATEMLELYNRIC